MTRTVITAGGIVSDAGRCAPGVLVVDGGRIADILPVGSVVDGDDRIDASDDVVAPGLIDLHTHGAGGVETSVGSLERLRHLSRWYARSGVTGFLASIGGSHDRIRRAIPALVELCREASGDAAVSGARCLGVHLEGPFISPSCPGAFPSDTLVAPDAGLFAEYIELGDGFIRSVTIAPELPGALDVIDAAVAHGVVCSAGHSAVDHDAMQTAITRGVRSVTHLFNAMPPLHHRRPGLVGVALTDERLVVELIADGIHVDPTVLLLTARSAGLARIALVTDSIASAGQPDGEYRTEEQDVFVAAGAARLADGTLAGSMLTLDRAVVNFAAASGLPWEQCIGCATSVPARLLGLDGRKGAVTIGSDADLVGFDRVRRVRWTMVGGSIVFRQEPPRGTPNTAGSGTSAARSSAVQ